VTAFFGKALASIGEVLLVLLNDDSFALSVCLVSNCVSLLFNGDGERLLRLR
jgi:hypothetical protein